MATQSHQVFTYSLENIILYEPNLVHTMIVLVVGIIGITSLWYILYAISGLLLLKKEAKAIEKKKNIL
jgi:uncharacterized membrane protein